MRYTRYLALGDSMSIDLYPALDAGEIDVAVALERLPTVGGVAPIGAASLLYENAEERWPEYAGSDLVSLHPGIEHVTLASDGATIGEVFGEQLTQVEASDELTLVTLTVGGNDLLSAYGNRPRRDLLERIEQDVAEAYDFLVDTIRGRFARSTLILTTVYDPSDGTGQIPGVYDDVGPLPIDILDRFNDHIRALALGTPRVLLADAHAHFLGHGVTAPDASAGIGAGRSSSRTRAARVRFARSGWPRCRRSTTTDRVVIAHRGIIGKTIRHGDTRSG